MTTLRKHTSSLHRLDAAASRPARRRARLLPVVGLVLAVALSACSGLDGSSNDGAAASGSDGGGGGSSDASQEDQILEFYQCLRDGGLDVPDPDGSGRITLEGIDPDNPDHMATVEDCADQYGLGGPGGGATAQRGDGSGEMADPEALIDFAACMRDNGIDMPDPSADGGLQMPEGLNLDSPEFEAAVEECQEHLAGGGVMVTR